ncbi:MAG: Sensor protein resE [Candidatus Saccharibacteria bacterium]|nr:Sensor protein resE [Candidatus Saccharibacteria bacterium]
MEVGFVLITCIINLALGLFIFSRDVKSVMSRAFLTMTVFICVWIISSDITNSSHVDLAINDVANRIAFAAGFGVVLSGLLFTYNFPVKRVASQLEAALTGVLGLFVIGLSFTSLIAGTVSDNGTLVFTNGPLLGLYVVGFLAALVLIVRNLIFLPKRVSHQSKIQARLVLVAFVITACLGLATNAIIPSISTNWQITDIGPLATIVLVIVVFYAIARHGLFDIRRAAVRTFAYALTLATLAVIYYFLAFFISTIVFHTQAQSQAVLLNPINTSLALVLAFIFQPIKRVFDRLTNLAFYRDTYDATEFFARITRKTSAITDLYTLLHYASSDISSTLKAQFAAFSIHETGKRPIYVATTKHAGIPQHDLMLLSDYVKATNATAVMTDDLGETPDDRAIQRMLKSYHVAFALPIIQDDILSSFLFLGEHQSSSYTNRDVVALDTIADELGIAIRNALSIHEVKNLNATLQQRIDAATKELRASNAQLQKLDEAKDEFISMASHQLRTPLTSIKGYISMLMDGDVGEVSKEQKHLLEEAFISSERMVRLIGDFLNVSRLQTGKFVIDKHPVDLGKIVGNEVENLKTNAETRGLKFTFKKPKNIPELNLDESKIQQVIMNFCDNAIYYSKDNSKIKVELAVVDNHVQFTVKDAGIGVPAAERDQLFTKFFRATNARKQRPDGTGVGLFLAKKVIDAHDGKIVFESQEGKGSTFGFRLPIKKI